jgi:hypothetical protein
MKIALVILGVLILIIIGFRLYNSNKDKSKLQPTYIRLIIPLSDFDTFNPDKFVSEYIDKWHTKIVCGETDRLKKDNDKQRIYLIGNGKHNLLLKINNCPLDKNFTDIIISASKSGFTANESIDSSEIMDLSLHKANLELEYMVGSEDKIDRIIYTSTVLISIFNHFKAVGFINVSAQSYNPVNRISLLLDKHDLLITDVFNIFVNTQLVKLDKGIEVHTHGAEQFFSPDIVLYSMDNEDINSNTEIIKNACLYNIESNNSLKIGDDFQLTGSSDIYKIETVKLDNEHPFGAFGVIGINKK